MENYSAVLLFRQFMTDLKGCDKRAWKHWASHNDEGLGGG